MTSSSAFNAICRDVADDAQALAVSSGSRLREVHTSALRLFLCMLVLTALAATAGVASSQERKLAPIDEAASDATWQRFKKRLLGAIERRDKQFLLAILDRDVRNQDERMRGIANFRKQWELDSNDSPVWHELATALQLGGAFIVRDKRRELCAPYLLGRWPDDLEPFKHAVVISRDTPVQSAPSSTAAALGTLSYDIVNVTDWEIDDRAQDARQKWVRIRYRDRDGFIPEEQVRSPIEQAACFVKGKNGWRMTAFAPAGGE